MANDASFAPRVLVTGAGGLLGSTLVPHLRGSGLEVLTHGRGGDHDVVADLSDRARGLAALESCGADVVVNLAAVTNVDACQREPDLAYRANVRVVETLAGWTRQDPRRHLVQISTDHVYDGPGLHDEDDVKVTNVYAFSKYAGELAAAVAGATILRTNFFGPSRSPARTSLSDWLVQSLRGGAAVTVFEDVLFSPVSIGTLVRLVEAAARRRPRGVFNVGSREGMSKAEFAYALADALSLPTATVKRGRCDQAGLGAYRPRGMLMDPSRFEAALGLRMPTLQQEIASMREAYGPHAGR